MPGGAVLTSRSRQEDPPLAAPDPSPTPLEPPERGRPPPGTIHIVIAGRIGRGDAAALCERVQAFLRDTGAAVIVCDVAALTHVDLATVDALARLRLAARRRGGRVWLHHASPELQELLALVGLRNVVPCWPRYASRRGGRPKIGKSRAVSRKKVIPLIRPPEISSTWSDHGS